MPQRKAPTGYDQARLSTTIILVRDSADGLQVWAQERVSTMRNYPGMTVFPGGGVDHRDFPSGTWDTSDLWTGQPVEQIQAAHTQAQSRAALLMAEILDDGRIVAAFEVAVEIDRVAH